MREEEKLARDVYLTLGKKWKVPVFSNISRAEYMHMSAVGALIDRSGLVDPVTDDAIGAFTNPHFTKLYEELVAEGSQSLAAAYGVGRKIEELDIDDLDKALDRTENETIRRVYQNLRRASGNHLRAFTRS